VQPGSWLKLNASTPSEEVVLPGYQKPNKTNKNKNAKNKLRITENMNCIEN